jgi:hypothetical protein
MTESIRSHFRAALQPNPHTFITFWKTQPHIRNRNDLLMKLTATANAWVRFLLLGSTAIAACVLVMCVLAMGASECAGQETDGYLTSQTAPLSEFRFTESQRDILPENYFLQRSQMAAAPLTGSHQFGWVPASKMHKRFYFEDPNLERCGISEGGWRQIARSAGKFGTVAVVFPLFFPFDNHALVFPTDERCPQP